MTEPIIVILKSTHDITQSILKKLHSKGYTWKSGRDLISWIPYSLIQSNYLANILIFPLSKEVRYNFSDYEGLSDSDGVNYVIKVSN